MNNPDYCTLLSAAHFDANLLCLTSASQAPPGAFDPVQFQRQTHGFVEPPGALRFADARL
jgi:hypothetical protein